MDSDDQLDNDEVLDDVGDEQEPLNEPNHESSQLWHSTNFHH